MGYHRVRFALQTVYTTGLCMLIVRLSPWGGLAYLSPVLSILTATRYFGEWQTTCWTVMYSSGISSILGVIAGYSWEYRPLQLFMIFIGVLLINKCTFWSPQAKTFGALCYVLGLLLPTLQRQNSLFNIFHLVALTNIPIVVTGFSLVFPFNMNSLTKTHEILSLLCVKLKAIVGAHINSFLSRDHAELYISMADIYTAEALQLLVKLKRLQQNLLKECYFFPSLSPLNHSLEGIVPFLSELLDRLRELKEIGEEISPNRTHDMFVEMLSIPLRKFEEEMGVLLEDFIVGNTTGILTVQSTTALLRKEERKGESSSVELSEICGFGQEGCLEEEGLAKMSRRESYRVLIESLQQCSNQLLVETNKCREKYVFVVPPPAHSPDNSHRKTHANLKKAMDHSSKSSSLEENGYQVCDSPQQDFSSDNEEMDPPIPSPSCPPTPPSTPLANQSTDSKLLTELYNENVWLGARNLAPRGAYTCRIRGIIDSVRDLEQILWPDGVSSECACTHVFILLAKNALVHGVRELTSGIKMFVVQLFDIVSKGCASPNKASISPSKYFSGFIHPLKVGVISTLASLLVISPTLARSMPYGLWGSIVTILIRQDSTASSFFRGYQRVEGTLVGCIFAFFMSKLFKCSGEDLCSTKNILIPFTLTWVALCTFHREHSQHGYAALVAAFTPLLILFGPVQDSKQDAAWARVEMTFLGVFLYLLVDNVVLPIRSDQMFRKIAVHSIAEVRRVVEILSEAMTILTGVASVNEMGERGMDEVATDDGMKLLSKSQEYEFQMSTDSWISSYQISLGTTQSPLSSLRKHIDKLQELMVLASVEPQLWYRSFPLPQYNALLDCFGEVFLSSKSLCHAHAEMGVYLASISHCQVSRHMTILRDMNKHLSRVFLMAAKAFNCHSKALERIFSGTRVSSDEKNLEASQTLSAIIALSRSTEKTLYTLNEEFRSYYITQISPLAQEPLEVGFIMHWQNLYGSTIYYVKKLSKLGVALHNVCSYETGIKFNV